MVSAWDLFLLHDLFDYTHAEVATIVEQEEATVRQTLHRAKAHVVARRPRFGGTREQHATQLAGFMRACGAADVQGIERMLAADVICRSEGGGKVTAAVKPIEGPARVALFLLGIARTHAATAYEVVVLNGDPAIVARVGGRVDTAVTIATDGASITEVDIVRNASWCGTRMAPSKGRRLVTAALPMRTGVWRLAKVAREAS